MTNIDNRQVIGPAMRRLLVFVLVLFGILVIDSIYLSVITFVQWSRGENLEGVVYQAAFLVHLAIGFLIVLPAVVFAGLHLARAISRPNRLAVRLGLTLFAALILLLISGVALTRGIALFELNDSELRTAIYWVHILTPLAVVWLFVLHRLAGPQIRWKVGGSILTTGVVLGLAGLWFAVPQGEIAEERHFLPSLARTASGDFIPAQDLMRDDYCAKCHSDTYNQWQHSAHRFASFNNPAYRFSVRKTRELGLQRDGNVHAARFCAGCHDPVPLFSGAFDDPDFDDREHPTASAGITCIACHGIEQIQSPRGNADYVIGAPQHYPFAFSEHAALRWVNELLIKANPAFHKATFLKPLHESNEFCGTCHKVHLPQALNQYKWLRGQNHYDSYLLSGVSGHGVQSFYYPEQAVENCGDCHMPLVRSTDFAAQRHDESGDLTIHDHLFPGANTAIAHLLKLPPEVNTAHREMLEGALRIDIFALRPGEEINDQPIAPLRPSIPALEPGKTYVLDIVLRTLTVGHMFTEGTADSNEVWLEVIARSGDQIIGRSGGLQAGDAAVDPWAHFVNAYVLDRAGNRIDRRNAEDIFTKLYDHQIPPGAADVVHYKFTVPQNVMEPITFTAALHYRKFGTQYMQLFLGDEFITNDLPIVTIATDQITFPLKATLAEATPPQTPGWERWNDYGIGFLRKPDGRGFRPAEAAFREVVNLAPPEGNLNLARVLIREGRLDEASDALRRAAANGAYPWSVAWFTALVDMDNGEFDAAIEGLTRLVETQFAEAHRRGFDFSKDYRLQNQLALALFERAKLTRGEDEDAEWLKMSIARYSKALELDPENLTAHYGLAQVYARMGNTSKASAHRSLHGRFRPDDNAHDQAVQVARRRDPAANHAADAIVINDLQQPGSYSLPASESDL